MLIVGAGLSGIGAACFVKAHCPTKSFAILEERHTLGGTWDLFRYPGIRSDSDMYTLGYSFRPWSSNRSIADGPSILQYLRDTAEEHGIDRTIRFGHRVRRALWSSADALWTVEAEVGPERDRPLHLRLSVRVQRILRLRRRLQAELARHGPVQRPHRASAALAGGPGLCGRRVVVIGSGATAVTLVPELAKDAAHVTMLQRSPTYIVSLPAHDAVSSWLHRWLPDRLAHGLTRWKNVLLNYALDLAAARFGTVDDGTMAFGRPGLERHSA